MNISHFQTIAFGSVRVEVPVLTATTLSDLINHLRRSQQKVLIHQSIDQLLSICDEAVARWLKPDDPHRRLALEALPPITGFSRPMIEKGLTLMLEGLRVDRLRSLLKEELGDPRFLDEFLPRLTGRSKAFGPGLITHILAGNIPALPASGLMTALLVKSASLAKTSSEEPLFPALFAKTLVEVEPELSGCIAVVGWKGGNQEAQALEEVALHRADLVLATGGEEAMIHLRRQLSNSTRTRLLEYGHRVSFGLIGREALTDLDSISQQAAFDVAMYDQLGCLSPHLFYVESGGKHLPRQFAIALSKALMKLQKVLPRGDVSTKTAAALHHFRSLYEMKQADGQNIGIFGSDSGNLWTVLYEDSLTYSLSPLFRTIRIQPIDDRMHVIPLLESWRPYLQAAGVAVSPERLPSLAESLGMMGVNRITSIGHMQKPGVGWHQDGRLTFGELVRWVDIENSE